MFVKTITLGSQLTTVYNNCFPQKIQLIEEDLSAASQKKKQAEKSALDLEETAKSRNTEISFLKSKLHDVEMAYGNLKEKQKDLEQECIVVKSKYSKLEAHYESVHEQKVFGLIVVGFSKNMTCRSLCDKFPNFLRTLGLKRGEVFSHALGNC